MSHSTRPVSKITADIIPEAVFTAGAWNYAVTTDDGRQAHREACLSADGMPLYEQAVPVDYAIGSGQRGISFVSDHAGAMFQSPLTWYAHGKRWDLSPGYRVGQHQRFERRIGQGCLNCHAGRTAVKAGGGERFDPPPFLEFGLSCERCHGPGVEHIRKHREHRTTADTIVNPRRLKPAARESVCYQCHLHGRERILQSGRWEDDFRPGDLVSDIWLVLVDEKPINQGPARAVSQSEQIVASRCAQGSAGAFGCISCHDPHGVPEPDERVAFYRQKCLECHGEGTSSCAVPETDRLVKNPLDSCIDCHMPRGLSADVPHTAQTDHRLLRDPSRTALHESVPTGSRPIPFQPSEFPVVASDVDRAIGLAMQQAASSRGQPSLAHRSADLLTPFSGRDSIDVAVLNAQAMNALVLGNADAAREFAARAHQLNDQSEPALEILSICEEQLQHHEAALAATDASLSLNSWSAAQHHRRARLLQRLGRLREALGATESSLRINPQSLDVRELQLRLLYDLGETNRAAAEAVERDRLRQTLEKIRNTP